MVRASLIYAVVTILLALVDAIREKVKWGKVANISHKISWQLAAVTGIIVSAFFVWHNPLPLTLAKQGVIMISFIAIRLVLFDPAQNLFRIFLKTNPTMRLDYVSVKTSSYEDQHTEKLSFWQKRAIGVVGWVIVLLVYNKIF
jgi:hypothetical protein